MLKKKIGKYNKKGSEYLKKKMEIIRMVQFVILCFLNPLRIIFVSALLCSVYTVQLRN